MEPSPPPPHASTATPPVTPDVVRATVDALIDQCDAPAYAAWAKLVALLAEYARLDQACLLVLHLACLPALL